MPGTQSRNEKLEQWWRDHSDVIYLRFKYMILPRRFRSNWKPSWGGAGENFSDVEDGEPIILLATHEKWKDPNKQVMLKKINFEEAKIAEKLSLSSNLYVSESIIDILHFPSNDPKDVEIQHVLVMPVLRPLKRHRFQTFDEFEAFFTQICENLKTMHEHKMIAHRGKWTPTDMMRFFRHTGAAQ